MLPKKNRISRALFVNLLKDGAFFHSTTASFRVVRMAPNSPSRFSFVVSKKVSKSAITRNLLRRRGYSVLQNTLGREKMKTGGFLGAFFLKKGVEKLKFKEFQDEIELLLKKSKIV